MEAELCPYVVVLYQGREYAAGNEYSISFRRAKSGGLEECPMSDVPVGIRNHPDVLVVD